MKRKIIPYNPKLKHLARNLRKNSTLSEVLLWRYLRNKQIDGYAFYRQKPLGKYIVDFFCYDLMLAIEIDGQSHGSKFFYDSNRQKQLESLGINFLRFQEVDIRRDIEAVFTIIKDWVRKHPYSPLKGTFARVRKTY